jgi:hypothetical protein
MLPAPIQRKPATRDLIDLKERRCADGNGCGHERGSPVPVLMPPPLTLDLAQGGLGAGARASGQRAEGSMQAMSEELKLQQRVIAQP